MQYWFKCKGFTSQTIAGEWSNATNDGMEFIPDSVRGTLSHAGYRPPPNQHKSVPGKATNATRLGVVPAESLFPF